MKTATALQVQEALQQGADINARDNYGWTALMLAASGNQNAGVIFALAQAGADLNSRDTSGLTALMLAARNNKSPEVITTLLKAGADAKVKDNEGKTALDYAQDNDALKGTDALKQLEEASQ